MSYPLPTKRRGAIVVLTAVMLTVFVAALALSIDYGVVLKAKTDLQRAADASALAAVQDLMTNEGNPNLDDVRTTARGFAASNMNDSSFQVPNGDIVIGRYDPPTAYSSFTIQNNGIFDTVQVTLKQDGVNNAPVSLFFAPLFGVGNVNVQATATAVLQKATSLGPGADILPFGVPLSIWDNQPVGTEWNIYGDGKIEDEFGNQIPGNWGTVDIGPTGNSSADLVDQILNGLRQSDLDALYNDGRIASNAEIGAGEQAWMEADTGLSSGIKSAVQDVHDLARIVPIYDQFNGQFNGNNLEFRVVKWGAVKVVDSRFHGANHSHVTIRKTRAYDGALRPKPSLTNTTQLIEGAFTRPVLVD